MSPYKAKDTHSGKMHAFKFSESQRNSNFTQPDTGRRQGAQPLESFSDRIGLQVSRGKIPRPYLPQMDLHTGGSVDLIISTVQTPAILETHLSFTIT